MTTTGGSSNHAEQSFSQQVGSLASAIREKEGPNRRGLSKGERAELRRMGAKGRIPPAVYWQLRSTHKILEENYVLWHALLPLMVRHQHSREVTPGRALAVAKVSPRRVERWLRLDREGALREIGRLLAKVEGVDWVKLARLLGSWTDKDRLQLAKDYYLSPEMRSGGDGSKEEGEE